MPWVRFDDQFPIHRKVKGLSDAAFRLHVDAIFWCARNLTDGFVPTEDVSDLATGRRPHRFIPELVSRGSWHESDQSCTSSSCPASRDTHAGEHGWLIHDYFDYQPTKEKVETERVAKALRQARWLEKKTKSKDASRDTSRDTSTQDRDASEDPSRDASGDAAPYPPRPEGSGAGYGPQRASPASAPNGARDDTRTRTQTRTLAIANCPLCDDHGYRGRTLCRHDPDAEARNQRGSALVHAVLNNNPRRAEP